MGTPRWLAPVVVASLLLVAVAAAAPAGAAPTATVRGQVGEVDGGPLAGVRVDVLHWRYGGAVATATTDAAGRWSVEVAPGWYRLRATDPSVAHATRFSGGAATFATAGIVVATGGSSIVADLELPVNDGIDGQVTDPGGSGLGGILVELLRSNGVVEATTQTAPDGTYTIPHVGPGSHLVAFRDPTGTWGATHWSSSSTRAGAATIATASTGTRHVVDQVLDPAATVTGRARIGTADPLEPLTLGLVSPPPPTGELLVVAIEATHGEVVGSADADPDGSFRIGGLAPGTYRVGVLDPAALGTAPTAALRPTVAPDLDIATEGVAGALAAGVTVTVGPGATGSIGEVVLRGMHCDPTTRGPGALLAGADLRDDDLRGCDLSGTDLTGADLRGTDLRSASLDGADLRSVTLGGTLLAHADLRGASLDGLTLAEPIWTIAPSYPWRDLVDVGGVQVAGASLHGTTWSPIQALGLRPDWRGTDFRQARIIKATLDMFGSWTTSYTPLFADGAVVPSDTALWGQPFLIAGTRFPTSTQLGTLLGADLTDTTCTGCRFVPGASVSGAILVRTSLLGTTGSPVGGASATYDATVCPDGTVTDPSTQPTCVGHGFAA